MRLITGICFAILFFYISACKKEGFITSPDARVFISADTLKFDTLFTTTGSVTQLFKIMNENNQKLKLSSVKLGGGLLSSYQINVDGFSGPEVNDLEIAANDSLYVFVTVKIDPTADDLPFVIQDSIQVTCNGVDRFVQLEAWGQNAHFFRDKIVSSNENWTNDKPYVILGSLLVNAGRTLTISKGCRIYVHADAPLLIDGRLVVNGAKDTADRVYFQGDRLDDPYKYFPGGWPGIYFSDNSRDNILNYAVIKNAYQALALEGPSPNANPKVTLNQTIIDNAYDAGIIAVESSLKAVNTLVSNCGRNAVLVKGGDYQFTHCTLVSYSTSFILHREPVLLVSNFITQDNIPVSADLNADFTNCIFWGENGTVDNEVVSANDPSAGFILSFNNALWKVKENPPDASLQQIINDLSPSFDSVNVAKRFYDFRLRGDSPARDAGKATSVNIDLDGKPRPVGLPDLGCFELQ